MQPEPLAREEKLRVAFHSFHHGSFRSRPLSFSSSGDVRACRSHFAIPPPSPPTHLWYLFHHACLLSTSPAHLHQPAMGISGIVVQPRDRSRRADEQLRGWKGERTVSRSNMPSHGCASRRTSLISHPAFPSPSEVRVARPSRFRSSPTCLCQAFVHGAKPRRATVRLG